jgi:copper homeostasis protein (lipoprotein)
MPTRISATAGIGLLIAGLLLAGCQPGSQAPLAGTATPGTASAVAEPTGDSERTWVGLLPCSDCQGIDTRLVLRVQGGRRSYLVTETYLGSAGRNSFDRSGSWNEQLQPDQGETAILYVLDPAQGGERFRLQPDGALELLEGPAGPASQASQALAYRLQRL